ncbi:MAG: hypothetical protein AABX78_00425 [Nanoarchaeota archaeon]
MVKTVSKSKGKYYVCEECNFAYNDKATAMKCEDWCKKFHSCNVEITKHAIRAY